ncbi:uncharacterized protein LOC111107362 [Crassostrea virginica]
MTPSCSSCDCDVSCLRKSSCCPSKFLQISNISSNIDSVTDSRQNNITSKAPLTCLTPFWNIHSGFHGTSYWMVDVCPNGESCSPDRSLWRNMSLFTPVTSISTNETYRYRGCALCNGEEEKALQAWKQDQIVCRTRADLLSAKLPSDVFVDEPDEIAACNILFSPPSTVQGSEISCLSFDRVLCNQSGTLDSDQAFLIEACDTFNIPYVTTETTFKNVYCAICNFPSLTLMPIEYYKDVGYGPSDTFPVFSALIDFKENIKPAYETPDGMFCAPGKIHNQHLLSLCVPSRYYKKSPNNQEIELCYDWYSRLAVSEPLHSQQSVYDEVNAYLSLTCLSLSTGGSILTIVSYCVRSGPLSSAGSNIVILSIFLISANTVYSLSKFLAFSKLLCLITGILVHFLWLSVMFWMSLSSFMIFNSFTNFSNVAFKQKSSVLRLLLVNCLLCSLFIVTNVIISHYSTGGENFGYSTSTCYIADPSMILYTFVLPVGAAVCVNTFMFIVTVSRIYQKEEVRKSRDQKKVSAYFRLSTLTGVSWCFGFLAQMTSLEVFSFLHTVFGAGQGVFLYLAFGLPLGFKCNPVHKKSTESSNTRTSNQ